MILRSLARVPIRARLTAAFAAAMAAVLVALGLFLAEQLEANLTNAIDQGLISRADQIAANGPEEQIGSGRDVSERGDDVAQLLSANGTVLSSTAGLTRPLLTQAQIRTLGRSHRFFALSSTQLGDDPTRVLAYRTSYQGRPIIVAAGASVQPLREARDQLVGLLLIGGPLALLLASGLGYAVAAAALRPVERMRSQAAAITADDAQRLTLPVARDELRALSETLNEMLDRLQDTLDRERAFTMDASHELRTPLAVLKAELEVALRPQRTREEQVDALRSASEETDRLTRLAEDLLVLSRADQQGLPIRHAEVDVGALLARVAGRFSDVAAARGVIVRAQDAADLTLIGDEDRLQQALSNLIANAVDHASSTVVVSAARADGQVTLAVSDDGDGFPPAFLAHAFERFTQADASRRSTGAGLGLAIVQAVAAAHGGIAVAENRSSGGARVRVLIPDNQEA